MEIALVAEGLGFPEGPVAMADGSVLVAEIKGRRITRVRPDGAKEVLAETGGGPNGARHRPGRRLVDRQQWRLLLLARADGPHRPRPDPAGA